MAFGEIISHSPPLRALRLDRLISESRRAATLQFLFFGLTVLGFFILFLFLAKNVVLASLMPWLAALFLRIPVLGLLGVWLIVSALFLALVLLEFYYRSNFTASVFFMHNGTEYRAGRETFRLLSSLGVFGTRDLELKTFFSSLTETLFGRVLLVRLGVGVEDIGRFISITAGEHTLTRETFFDTLLKILTARTSHDIGAGDVLEALYTGDAAFSRFLFNFKVKPEELVGAAEWVESECEREHRDKVWWARDILAQIPGIGKDFGFGYTYTLDQYSRELLFKTTRFSREARREEIRAIESVLARSYEANVLLVGEEGVGKHAILEGFAERIREGTVVPALEHKRVVVLDGSGIVAAARQKGAFEGLMIRVLNEALSAGNIILVIENLPGFIESAFALGSNIIEVLEPALGGSAIQVIALSDPAAFHRDLEPNGKIGKLFEKVDIEEPSPERTLRMIEDALDILEPASGKYFTYKAIRKAVELADRFITEGAMPEKAIDLLNEAVSSASPGTSFIGPEDIEVVVKKRTNIPTGEAEAEERETLLHMEELLRRRIVDQEHAVRAIADALRRARSGLTPGSRPIGSFLFLGPTGVGKTETAKALAEVYFGDEDAMIRFDMSEYWGEEGLRKLIGGYAEKEPGVLSNRVRERPFSLLLFDEFEKASREVLNLFLQILDEGFFSDASGRRVSMRETMIIATSNAGTPLIWSLLKEGKEFADIESSVLNSIRQKGTFSFELLNRFDSIVVFHPLDREQLIKVSMLLLGALAQKLAEKEIHFEPTPELASRVVDIGYDPINGARPMRRAVADRVEQVIAKKILDGSLKRGDTFMFSKEDIERL